MRRFAPPLLFAALLAACSGGNPSPDLHGFAREPAVRLRPHVSVTPPPSGTSYTYDFSVLQSVQPGDAAVPNAAPVSGSIVATWTTSDGVNYTLALSGASLLPLLQAGTYTFAVDANGNLDESFHGYRTSEKARNYVKSSSSIDDPAKLVAAFPLQPAPASSVAVKVTSASALDDETNRCHPQHEKSNLTSNADGSYSSYDHEQDYPGCIGRGFNTATKQLASDGSGTADVEHTDNIPAGINTRETSWGLPIRRNGKSVIPVRVTVRLPNGGTLHSMHDVPDWYPSGHVPSPLSTDTMSVVNAAMPASCTGYAGVAATATVESISALDPVEGTIVTTTATSYYLGNALPLVCGVSSTVTQHFNNVVSGRKLSTVTNQTVVVLAAPTGRTARPRAGSRAP